MSITVDLQEYATSLLAQTAYPTSAAETIDVGSAAIDRNSYAAGGTTTITALNPANGSGTLTSVAIFMLGSGVVKIGIWYATNGNTLKCRSVHECGSLGVGYHTIPVNMAISAGDYIGIYGVSGAHVEYTNNAGGTVWYKAGEDHCIVDDETTYSTVSPRTLSCYAVAIALQCYSESVEKVEGSYSLEARATTGALNETLTRTIGAPIDLTDQLKIKFNVRASRTGTNIKAKIRDSGSTWSEYSIIIAGADTWEAKQWDISGVGNPDKDVVDRIQFEIIEAGAANVIYIDNMVADAGETIALTATATIVSSTSASLTRGTTEAMTATAVIATSVQGQLSIVQRFTATAAITTSTQASLTLGVVENLTATAVIALETQGVLSVIYAFTATGVITTSTQAALTRGRIEAMTATAAIISLVQGALSVLGRREELNLDGDLILEFTKLSTIKLEQNEDSEIVRELDLISHIH